MRLTTPTLDTLRRHAESGRSQQEPIGLWEFVRKRVRDIGTSSTGKPTMLPQVIITLLEGLLQVNPMKRWSTARGLESLLLEP
jgi:hypothetical protein